MPWLARPARARGICGGSTRGHLPLEPSDGNGWVSSLVSGNTVQDIFGSLLNNLFTPITLRVPCGDGGVEGLRDADMQ